VAQTPDGRVFLEKFSYFYPYASKFLVAIAEPVSRPKNVEEYIITPYSLYAAASVGLRTERIIATLDKFCKTPLPDSVIADLRNCTQRYGKVKLVLRQNRFFLETADPDALQILLRDPVIQAALVEPEADGQPTLDEPRQPEATLEVGLSL
jgi:DNA excision repair protein ERCC-3